MLDDIIFTIFCFLLELFVPIAIIAGIVLAVQAFIDYGKLSKKNKW